MLTHDGWVIAHNNKIDVIDCKVCGYAHQSPLPSAVEIDAYYAQDEFYRTHSPGNWFEREDKEHALGLWHAYYLWEARHFPKRATILDIGCGTGWFSWDVRHYTNHYSWGIDPSKSARDNAHAVIYESIEKAREYHILDKPLTTNSVRLRLVLEHLHNPAALLRQCHELVGSKGYLEVVVPNEFNPLQNRIRKQYGNDWFVQKPHLNYFTKASIKTLLRNTGWEVVTEGATFPVEAWWMLGKHYLGNDKLGHELHVKRLLFEQRVGTRAFDLYQKLYQWFGIGRELIVFARRVL